MISKKELLKQTGISYGQLYRWKREGLIPEEWFKKTSAPTGQETFFDEDEILPRVRKILELKDDFSIEEMRRAFAVKTGGEEIETKALFAIPDCNTEIVNALAAGGTVSPEQAALVGAFSKVRRVYGVNLDLLTHFPEVPEGADAVCVLECGAKRFVAVVKGEAVFSSDIAVLERISLAEEQAQILAKTQKSLKEGSDYGE